MSGDQNGGTRARLVDAAARLFWERSFTAAGVDEVCRLADARKGSFYHFFASKTALALETVDMHWAMVEEAVFKPVENGTSRGINRLIDLVDRIDLFQREAQTRTAAVLGSPFGHLGQEMAHQEEVLRRAVEAVFVAQCAYLERWLDEAAAMEQLAPGNNGAKARQVLALIEGALMLAKVADAPGVFHDVCGNLPALLARNAPAAPPGDVLQPGAVPASSDTSEAGVVETESGEADRAAPPHGNPASEQGTTEDRAVTIARRPAAGLPEFD